MNRLRVLAHRGASAEAPENTLAAVRAALGGDGPADGLEFDVRLSADGVPFAFHDDTTGRLAGVPGALETRAAEQIERLRVRGEPIPRLAELIDLVLALRPNLATGCLNVELKPTGSAEPLIRACAPVLENVPLASLVVSSFDPRVLLAARSLDVPWRLGFIYDDSVALTALPSLEATGPIDLHPNHRLVNAGHLAEYARPQRRFRCWTVDDPAEALRLAGLAAVGEGALTALITNHPRRICAALAASQASRRYPGHGAT